MSGQPTRAGADPEGVRAAYVSTFGAVPAGIEDRLRLAVATGRENAVLAVEDLRRELLARNPLGARVQQLVHLGQLLALGRAEPARLHARGALRAGASLSELVGVAETALITAGMPAYSLGIAICAELLDSADSGSGHLDAVALGRAGTSGSGQGEFDQVSEGEPADG